MLRFSLVDDEFLTVVKCKLDELETFTEANREHAGTPCSKLPEAELAGHVIGCIEWTATTTTR